MSSFDLTPPSRHLESWRYVTPSLLKELSSYSKGESKSLVQKSNALVISAGKVISHENSLWADALDITSFSDLDEAEKQKLPQAKTEEQDCFSDLTYDHQEQTGLVIKFPKEAPSKEGLNLTIHTEGHEQIVHQRLHFIFPKCSEHHLNLRFTGPQAEKYANLTEMSFYHEAGSQLKCSVLCEDNEASMTLTGFQHQLMRDSRVSLHILNTENRLTRHRLQVELCEENAEVELIGLGSLANEGSLHHYLDIRHLVPHCRSRQLFKTALAGKTRSSFDGTIQVSEKAIATEADQLSRYLLLSPETRANAKPQLKIYADDVVCTHGSTIGQIEEEEMFYLQTRGLSAEQSHHLLARGFLEEVLSEVPHQAFADVWRENFLNKQFPLEN